VRHKLLHEDNGLRTYALIFESGDEAMSGLLDFAKSMGLRGSRITAIGAFQDATLAYFNWETKEYESIPVGEQTEVLSLLGDIALDGEEPAVHAHAVLGRRDGSTVGGHLKEGKVRPTLEVIIDEQPEHLHKAPDRESGLALIRP
jgi:predicted DNA-binding protein with PD1-like motif